jgi:hypothetical protein
MADQIVLAWTVNVAGTSLGPAAAATALGAVPLYNNATTDPVLGQLFGLTVASDVTAPGAGNATRTLTLNMTRVPGAPFAPPPFPCHPDTSTPPVLPFRLRRTVPLAGAFLTTTASAVVATSAAQISALSIGDTVEFLSQLGVFYTVLLVGATTITLTAPYTGVSADGAAVKVQAAPVVLPALFSTSPLDTAGFATVPAIPAGSGARTISLSYLDSTGAGPFTVVVPLTGRRPAAFALGGGIDIATITAMHVASTGAFNNSVGQITLVELSSALPAPLASATPADFLGPLTDEAQLLITRALTYLPPSYFALSQQGASTPQLAGDFFVTTGSASVPTTADQTAALAPGNTIQFAEQLTRNLPFETAAVLYTVASVSPKIVKLTTPFTGIDNNNTGTNQAGTNSNRETKGNLGSELLNKATGAYRITPTASAPPTNAALAGALGQFVTPGNAIPPPNPPLPPGTMSPAPTFLSGLFTQTLSLALAVPVVPSAVAFI